MSNAFDLTPDDPRDHRAHGTQRHETADNEDRATSGNTASQMLNTGNPHTMVTERGGPMLQPADRQPVLDNAALLDDFDEEQAGLKESDRADAPIKTSVVR